MKLLKIFRFEFLQQLRSAHTWICLIVLFAFAILMNAITTPGDGVYANNTFHIISVIVVGGFIWLFIGASIAGTAASSDIQARMHLLTYSTSVSKLEYLGGKFLAAFTVNALLQLALLSGVILSFYMGLDDAPSLPFRPSIYLNVYFIIALPYTFIATSLQFVFALLGRRVMTSYLASLLIAIFPQIIAIALADLFGDRGLVKLLDPVGVASIIGSELSTWTPTEKNTRLVVPEGMFLLNRILWVSVALMSLIFTYARFSFVYNAKQKNNKKTYKTVEIATGRSVAVLVPQVQQNFGSIASLYQALRIALGLYWKMVKNPIGLTLVTVIALVSVAFSSKIVSEFGMPLQPTTNQVLNYIAAPVININTPWAVIPLLIIYFAGQLVWYERDARMMDISDSKPVTEWILLAGKFMGLALLIISWIAIIMTGGILMQASAGYHNFEIALYLKTLFGLQLVDYLLFAIAALVMQVVVDRKYPGYLSTFLLFIFIAFHSVFGIEHSMLVFGAGPHWTYSDMRGFGSTFMPWLWFKLYWLAWATLLALIAILFCPRGREHGVKHRVKLAKQRFTGPVIPVAIAGTGLLLVLGGFVFYNTNILNEYLSGADINGRKARYELLYGKYRNAVQPQLLDTKLNVDIYPDRQKAVIQSLYTLVNNDSIAIDSIHLGTVSPGIELREVNFNRAFINVITDKTLGHYVYTLQQPLAAGDSVRLNFTVTYESRGFHHTNTNTLVTATSSYFTNYDVLPVIGYRRSKEIIDAVTRKEYDLPARPVIPLLDDDEARKKPASRDRNSFEAVVSTENGQVAVAPGALLRTWTANDRSYFHYKTDAPIRGEYAFLSGNYSVKQNNFTDVDIRLYYHPRHDLNADRIIRSVKASMEYYTEQFGPYPYKHITIVEHPGDGAGAHAEASMIDFGERYALMDPGSFDLPHYIMAHEVAHQWFGSAQLTPANVEGAGVLIEGLAVYLGMQVLQKDRGDDHLRQHVKYLHSFYEMPRSLASNSLLRANESFLYYRKGGLAMHVLSRYIGKEKVNGALRDLLQKHHSGQLSLPTTLDLFDEMKMVTPDSLSYLLHDLFETNTYWRVKTRHVKAEQTAEGTWDVTLLVQAQKITVDSTGAEHDVRMNDWLEIGVYDSDDEKADPIYLQMHKIRSGDQEIKITVRQKPLKGGIDPNGLMIDLRMDDNVKTTN